MKFNKKYTIPSEFESLFAFESKEDEFVHEAKMIMFRFLSEIEKLTESGKVKKKDLAKEIGTSASYITQLYHGDKLINLLTLAKIQDAYDFIFEIKAKPNVSVYESGISVEPNIPKEIKKWKPFLKEADYNNNSNLDVKDKTTLLRAA